jgi:sugar-phosphatase
MMVTSDEVLRGKPAPDGFLLGAERLGVEPSRAVVVEDAPPGLDAARAAGMRVIALTTTHHAEHLGVADTVIPDLTRLRFAVEQDEIVLDLSPP